VNIDALLDELAAEATQAKQRKATQQAQPEQIRTGKWARGGMTVDLFKLISEGVAEPERSDRFFDTIAWLRRLDWTADAIVGLLEKHPGGIAAKYEGRLRKEVERAYAKVELRGVTLGDFFASGEQHQYIFRDKHKLWPAISIDRRLPAMALLGSDNKLVVDDKGNPVLISASTWLDRNRSIEGMTWAPGEPELVHDRLMIGDVGWIAAPGKTTFNQYRPPLVREGDPRKARPWLRLVYKVFGHEAKHVIQWFAHRVQRPEEKINHGLIFGGEPNIGKDTILEPVRQAIGEWNFREASPDDLFGTFNGFNKAVILRINETRDLGEAPQHAFYNKMKNYLVSPPATLPTNEKFINQYEVANICGVVFTTNYRETGLYLPANDRRHFVLWSPRREQDFTVEYWAKLWGWYESEGYGHIAAFLRQLDLSAFNPKAPPPKTAAFWAIVNANRATEEAELDEVLDRMGRPAAVTLDQVLAQQGLPFELGDWLRNRKNLRVVPKHFRESGYVSADNPDSKQRLWTIGGRKQAVYARDDLSPKERWSAARRLTEGK
jgi:hypothetical protein